LPVEDLQFTRETEDQLAIMAGNAMTCTVVGAVLIGALAVNQGKEKRREEKTRRERRRERERAREKKRGRKD
jgi:hypothetical protein